jgi:hypothetical protein
LPAQQSLARASSFHRIGSIPSSAYHASDSKPSPGKPGLARWPNRCAHGRLAAKDSLCAARASTLKEMHPGWQSARQHAWPSPIGSKCDTCLLPCFQSGLKTSQVASHWINGVCELKTSRVSDRSDQNIINRFARGPPPPVSSRSSGSAWERAAGQALPAGPGAKGSLLFKPWSNLCQSAGRRLARIALPPPFSGHLTRCRPHLPADLLRRSNSAVRFLKSPRLRRGSSSPLVLRYCTSLKPLSAALLRIFIASSPY